MKRIAVFCGSSAGNDTVYASEAKELGRILALRGIEVIYGGGRVGIMGAVADGALAHGGKVTGVIPYFLKAKEVAHEGLTELILVNSMHERKTRINDLSDGVIALPGGFGTMDEFFEMLTWAQLGLHQKPMGLLNVKGYFNALDQMVQHMVDEGFLKKSNQSRMLISENIEDLLVKMDHYTAPIGEEKWIDREKT
ncbi:MAG: TIGR00730 family Rossman fold protein [Bacteroidales bacterium]